MAKSSPSSSRKKRPKHSSLERARKKSKTKRAKAKKLRRHDDLDSYSSDDSTSSASVFSSSEDTYRGRKSTRKDAKGTKRRGRSRSSSSEESLVLKKRKGSKRKVDSVVRKKTLKHKKKKTKKKKKSRRDASISSRSCSTGESSSDESEYERRSRGKSKRREKSLKSSKNAKSTSKKRRYRSISCSSGSRDSGSDYWRDEKVIDGSISKRLKSVITFTKDDDMEEKELDEHKEEIIYEDDGYPSSRSNDSFDGGNKRISGNQSPIASEKKSSTVNEKKEEPFDIKTTELSGRCLGGDDQSVEEKPASDGFGTNDSLGVKTDEIAKTDDLEILLRQKALENLNRFRGINANKKDESCAASESPCPRKAGLNRSDPKDGCTRGDKGDSLDYLQEEKIVDVKNGASGSASVENNVCLTNKNRTLSRGLNKQRLVTTALKQALSNCTSSAVEAPKVKLVNELDVTCVGGKSNNDKDRNAAAKSSAGVDAGLNRLQDEERLQAGDSDTVNNASGSSSAAQDVNSSEEKVDGKESSGSGSQLERKTMSVMRGGELVQVSYKVYIPKKAPALARRQLNR
ncbi:hypothetical protein M5689_013639 [Euphorbia peplus]|nr:hypothetical protein M5689_013639 [Euphorbia peplus]